MFAPSLTRIGRLWCLAASLLAVVLIAVPSARAVEPVLTTARFGNGVKARPATANQPAASRSYTELSHDIASRDIASAAFSTLLGQMKVKLKSGELYTVGYPPGAEQALAKEMIAGGASVTFDNGPSATSGSALGLALPTVLMVALGLGMLMVLRRGALARRERARARRRLARPPHSP